MRLLRGLHNIPAEFSGCAITIGNFDGLHLGHQAILHGLHAAATGLAVPTLVMIFEPQPKEFFAADQAPARLANLREKLLDLDADHVDYVLCLPFNQALRSMSADDFIKQVLVDTLGIRHLIVGDDFRFGCDRRGDYALLASAGQQYGFVVQNSSTFLVAGERVSSTRIRKELEANRLGEVRKLLGRTYRMSGRVAHGRELGRTLNTPTANVMIHRRRLPLCGVYAVATRIQETGEEYLGVANVGIKPTISLKPEPSLEVHLFGFSGDLYGQHLTVEFWHRIRGERAFDGLESLQAAIDDDKRSAQHYFATLPYSFRDSGSTRITTTELNLSEVTRYER
ncbi:bifunctional riboflavin kinase/FAD synthetase [Oceanobacter sp. 5_MG-2023]|uniref:bifunctional riboflavin kinase/FAD synthetase n=1 Tax=Oceanobacter sp. 5_MG-2023 TaxID=3062645 RepID=UPI0026E16FC0|nr:bifunctional riboflavin kinase/FAD synthetase [Oceanobacter sp. 5_MG-2023]MDO6681249.1 bifunctional riboflavin kinase/FAD synthetase [Oceanobacter sp. 5_MG-2023]